MNQIAFILENTTLYWYSIVLALAAAAGICFFLACCASAGIRGWVSGAAVLVSVALSLLFARLLYWNCRADTFENLTQALTTPASGCFALAGAFFGCGLTALLLGRPAGGIARLLDCMSVAGCGAIALGRLANFFSASDRGSIVTEMVELPWAYPVINAASGLPEYRLATFLFQAALAGLLFVVLSILFYHRRARWSMERSDLTVLFLLVYGASQVILDSTRYDSLYLRINGFVSMVQILAAVALAAAVVLFAVRAVRARGFRAWMAAVWVAVAGLFGLAGYMEYYVQRHGRRAFFAYSVMEHCLVLIVVLGITLWICSMKKDTRN